MVVLSLSAFMVMSLSAFSYAVAKEFAYLTPGLDLPFWRYLAKGIEDEAKKAGHKSTTYDSNNDAAKQLANAQDAIAKTVDGIMISPTDSSTCPKVLELAKKAGIPVVIADIGTESGDYVSFVISDNTEGAYSVGKLLATKLVAKGWKEGPVGLVTISLARANGQKRTAGFRKAMTEAGIKEAALKQMQLYTGDETFKYVQDMITANPNMRGIFIQTDNPTLGAVRAVQTARMGDNILVAGFDGVPEFVDLIKSGKLIGSGMRQPYLMGQRSMQALLDHLGGKQVPKEIMVPIMLVSQDNLEQVLPTIKQSVFAGELK
ncbi:MAG: substrate-binding domain-containing protein [Deltaproteobacteria bacterium]|nr:substrate-binding domain-containing protein [Deltaproteobacteria bacterium]